MTRRDAATSTGPSDDVDVPAAEPQSPPSQQSRGTPKRGRSRRKRHDNVNSIVNRQHREDRRRRRLEKYEPFWITFTKVGTSVMMCSFTCYVLFLQYNLWIPKPTEEAIIRQQRMEIVPKQHLENLKQRQQGLKGTQPAKKQVDEAFQEEKAWTDAYGIASEYQLDEVAPKATVLKAKLQEFAEKSEQVRSRFAAYVGGEAQARAILQRSLLSVQTTTTTQKHGKPPGVTSPHGLARRLVTVSQSYHPTFTVAVLGSSAAAGSGNLFPQSYAFGVEKLLTDVFSSLNIDLRVRNLAVEDTDEFPTIWCLDHYFPHGLPDVLVWDFGLTSTPESLEAFLRHVASREDAPFLILRDSLKSNKNQQRDRLLQAYVDSHTLVDPLMLHVDQAAAPFLNQPEVDLPEGFQQWRTSFGGPPGAPGKEHTHLTVKQHSMIAWLISMHVLSALELVVADQLKNGKLLSSFTRSPTSPKARQLPPPLAIRRKTAERWMYDEKDGEEWVEQSVPAWFSLLAGEPQDPANAKSRYTFPPGRMQCRTTYTTAFTNDTMDDVLVSGSLTGPLDLLAIQGNRAQMLEELLLPKGAMFYSKGWVRDLDKATKRQKSLTKQWGFLGFEAMIKKAYYGLPSSGDLNLFLPLSNSTHSNANALGRGSDFVESILLCETDLLKYHASEATSDAQHVCRLKKDAAVFVGGEMGFLETIPFGVASNCVLIRVPEGAKLTYGETSQSNLVDKISSDKRVDNNSRQSKTKSPGLGLSVDIRVRSDKGNFKEPCSVAHVMWQERDEES